jgi:hypothetical protein
MVINLKIEGKKSLKMNGCGRFGEKNSHSSKFGRQVFCPIKQPSCLKCQKITSYEKQPSLGRALQVPGEPASGFAEKGLFNSSNN